MISYNGSADVIDLSGHYKSPEYVRKYLTMNGTEDIRTLSLTSKAPSQYAAYLAELELFDIDQIMSGGTLGLPDDNADDIIYFNDTSVELINKDYYVNYADGAVEITYGSVTVLIEKAGSESSGSGDISVYYGNITEKTALNTGEGCIYLDAAEDEANVNSDMNNFEIIFSSDSGGAEIRRL
ncbi:MAG: hypothetical protein LUD57_02945 [Ruminococcus sp.]|nr:hypothetical protein [Ruminococcus sp.]